MDQKKLKQIQLLLLDVDGVLTDGGIIYDDHNVEIKIFNAKDGLGLRLLMDAGVQVGIVTGRAAPALRHRCENLGIKLIFDGVTDKGAVVGAIEKQTGVTPDRMLFMGDDLPDLPLMKKVGVSASVADANPFVQAHAHIVTRAPGGRGAVREICEAILNARGVWDGLCRSYL
jgi:3-deoxy-D-manno-octulosonate 8-phosphate phosphatase (KDO 8-P phosphatase)